MKKLLVLALSAVLVFAVASISMAAVAVTGEANFALQLSPSCAAPQSSDVKLVFDAAVNDDVSVNAAVKATSAGTTDSNLDTTPYDAFLDTYSASIKMATGTLKVGYFGTNFNGSTDILAKAIGDLKGAANVNYSAPFGDAITAQVQYSYMGSATSAYLLGVKYASDAIEVGVGLESAGGVSATAINFAYKMDALTAYLNYENNDPAKDEIIGVVYTAGDLTARFEYDLVKDAVTDKSPMGIGVAYGVNGVTYKLIYTSIADVATATVKATVKF